MFLNLSSDGENTEEAALEMMNMSPAILNYTVKFNQTVSAVQYNDTNSSSPACIVCSSVDR